MFKYTALFFMLIFFSSCASIGSKLAPAYVDAFKAIKNAVVGFEDTNITKETVARIPYASSLLKIGKGPQGLLILESISSDKETWISADGIYLIVKNGRIVRTEGLQNNLTDFISPLVDFSESNNSETYKYYYSYDFPYLRDLEVLATIKTKGLEEVELFNEILYLQLIEEEIISPYLGWKFTNRYWVDKQNNVIKSIQQFSPKLPEFTIVVTKKPS